MQNNSKRKFFGFLLLGGFFFSLFCIAADSLNVDELFKKAEQASRDKKFDLSIHFFEEVIKLNPNYESAKRKLALAYEEQASVLLDKGLAGESLNLLEKSRKLLNATDPAELSIELDPIDREMIHLKQFATDANREGKHGEKVLAEDRARLLFAQAVDSFKEKQYGLARGFLKEGIAYDSSSALAHELLGDIEYYSQNLEAADQAYQKSFSLNRNDRVEEKISRLHQEKKIETKTAEYLDEHFIIRYNRKENVEGSEIREYLRNSYREVSGDFGHYLDYKTVVLIYGKEEFDSVSQIPHWSGALFDGKIRIPFYKMNLNKEKLQKLIQHELTHVFVSDLSKDKAPVWLHEGLAQYEENKIVPVDLRLIRAALRQDQLLKTDELEKGVIHETSEMKALMFYHQSFLMVSKLIADHRFVKIKQFLKKLSEDQDFHAAFLNVFSQSFHDFYSEWKDEEMSRL